MWGIIRGTETPMGAFVAGRGAIVAACLFLAACLAVAPEAAAQYFGRNKVEYEKFAFEVLATDHFDVYYNPRERQAVEVAARLAERWYARLSRALDHQFTDRQPLVLYGSHPDFAQTNVVSGFLDDGIAGITESRRRRIVMPFFTAMGTFDRVLGHEVVHAFQYDIARRHKGTSWVPLWFAEGMAEYLSGGPVDPMTAMWLRDAVTHDKLPRIEELSRSRHSPYRFGHALWTYLAQRFGDDVIPRVLKAGRAEVVQRLETVTGVDRASLTRDWHAAVKAVSEPSRPLRESSPARALMTRMAAGRYNFGPALSPDGRQLVFFSEKDRVSIDLFLADVETGRVTRTLATTAANPDFESLQSIHSSGAWAPDGRRFAFSAVRQGRPLITILDVRRGARERDLHFPQFGEIANPRWSPDGRRLAFSGLQAGFSDLYVYDIESGDLRQITADAYTDLQPAWSPDGARLAFVTDRFSTDLRALKFGLLRIALVDLKTGAIEPLSHDVLRAKQIDPHWSPDGRNLYYVSDAGGVSNVYRFDVMTGDTSQISDVATGVTGLTAAGPALSVASGTGTLAFSVLRGSGFEIRTMSADESLAARPPVEPAFAHADRTTPGGGGVPPVSSLLADATTGLPSGDIAPGRRFVSNLQLDALGTPYVAFGGGRFGGYVRGGTSFLFGDMLGERKFAAALQLGSRLSDVAVMARYLNRASRWNWGGSAEVAPYVRGWSRTIEGTEGTTRLLTREAEQLVQMHSRAEGILAYPFSRTRRLELTAGLRHINYARRLHSRVFLIPTRRLVSELDSDLPSADGVTIGEAAAALVADTAVHGPTAPILGTRARVEITPSFGELSFTRVLLDYRRYVMPVKPYTIAARVMHIGRYGRDANDPRLLPHFLGFRHLVRGYDSTAFRECRATGTADCAALDALQGTRLAVANVEVRFPILGMRSGQIRYGPIPLEGVLFADAGMAWGSRSPRSGGAPARSIGAAVRTHAFGMILELGAVRPLDRIGGWGLSVNFRPGF
jgi:Tol biopolymer transport system component